MAWTSHAPNVTRSLPQWVTRQHSGVSRNNKLKLALIGALCIALGWMVASIMGPSQSLAEFGHPISGEILEDPYDAGTHHAIEEQHAGIIDDANIEGWETANQHHPDTSVSSALSSLGHAVSSKLKSWNTYLVKPSHQSQPAVNQTIAKPKNHTSVKVAGEYIKDGVSEEDRLGARVRIGKVTILFRGSETWERCIRTHEEHDRYHGYRLHVLRREMMDSVWTKPAYILSLLLRELSKPESERLDWLFWVDSDTIILNPRVPIETFLPPQDFEDIYLIYSNDWNGLNNGVFPVRVNQWSVNLFAAIVSYRHYKPEVHLNFRDQSAMNNLMQEGEFAKHIIQAPQRWFNAYQGEHNQTLQPFQVRRGDLLVHFAGVGPREERMKYWLHRAEAHLDEWEVPVKSTSYPEEAREFWEQQRGFRREKERKLKVAREEAMKLIETTEKRLQDYGDKLTDDERNGIQEKVRKLRETVDKQETKDDQAKIEECTRILSDSAASLMTAIGEANKILLRSAHEAIFAGEKVLLDAGFHDGKTSPELDQISVAINNLKGLIMIPEERWSRPDITAATNTLTDARTKQEQKVAAEKAAADLAEQQRKQQEDAAKTKAQAAADAATKADGAALRLPP